MLVGSCGENQKSKRCFRDWGGGGVSNIFFTFSSFVNSSRYMWVMLRGDESEVAKYIRIGI